MKIAPLSTYVLRAASNAKVWFACASKQQKIAAFVALFFSAFSFCVSTLTGQKKMLLHGLTNLFK